MSGDAEAPRGSFTPLRCYALCLAYTAAVAVWALLVAANVVSP